MSIFVAIAEHGSLTAAATALGRSLPSTVRALAALESELGVRLIQRTTRRQHLTDAGHRYLDRARRILDDVAESERAVSELHDEPAGGVRVAAPILFGQLHVAPMVAEFAMQYPNINVELVLSDRSTDLIDADIDVAVRIAHLPDSNLVAQTVGALRRVVVASPEFLETQQPVRHPRDLAREPCVGFSGLMRGDQWPFIIDGRRTTVPIQGRFRCNQAAAAVAAVCRGLGYGMFLSYQVEAALAAKQLRIVLEEFEPPPIPISVLYPEARFVALRARLLIDWMAERLSETLQYRHDATAA